MTEQAIGQLVPHVSSGLLVSLSTGRIFEPDGLEVGIQTSGTYVRVIRRQSEARTPVTWYAHRLVWEAANGPIPEGMQILPGAVLLGGHQI